MGYVSLRILVEWARFDQVASSCYFSVYEIGWNKSIEQPVERVRTARRIGRDRSGHGPRPCCRGNRSSERNQKPDARGCTAGRGRAQGMADAANATRHGGASNSRTSCGRSLLFLANWMPMKRTVIYLDTSVVLAQLLAEDHRPPASLWGRDPGSQPVDGIRGLDPTPCARTCGVARRGRKRAHRTSRLAGAIPTSARARPGRLSRACSHARRPASGVMRLPAQPRAVGLACQLRPPDDRRRPRPGSAHLRPGTLLNRATGLRSERGGRREGVARIAGIESDMGE